VTGKILLESDTAIYETKLPVLIAATDTVAYLPHLETRIFLKTFASH
jgi:hypothetical protein